MSLEALLVDWLASAGDYALEPPGGRTRLSFATMFRRWRRCSTSPVQPTSNLIGSRGFQDAFTKPELSSRHYGSVGRRAIAPVPLVARRTSALAYAERQPFQSSRKSTRRRVTTSGCSSCGRCPHCGIAWVTRLPAISCQTFGMSNILPTA
jgi:hypothetical protein